MKNNIKRLLGEAGLSKEAQKIDDAFDTSIRELYNGYDNVISAIKLSEKYKKNANDKPVKSSITKVKSAIDTLDSNYDKLYFELKKLDESKDDSKILKMKSDLRRARMNRDTKKIKELMTKLGYDTKHLKESKKYMFTNSDGSKEERTPIEHLKRATSTGSGGSLYKPRGYKTGSSVIGWFAIKQNMANGFALYNLDKADLAWFKDEKEPTKGVYRYATDIATGLVSINAKTGVYRFFDNAKYESDDRIHWQKWSKYNRIVIDDLKSFKAF
jgi:hypothetical protein